MEMSNVDLAERFAEEHFTDLTTLLDDLEKGMINLITTCSSKLVNVIPAATRPIT